MLVIIGKNGQLAKKCLELVGVENAVCLGRADIDITSDSLVEILDKIQPSAIINASAYTAVDLAESEENKATAVNYNALERLSNYCSKRGFAVC
jgi:dTDP-4-dehydrorhamnose reductase